MSPKGLKILSLNVRSLYPHLNELYVRFKDYDILCFSETWLNGNYKDEMISMESFDIFRLDREKGGIVNKAGKPKRGGGLIIYVKKELSKFTQIIEDLSSISDDLEQLWIHIQKPDVSAKIISCIYRPPSGKVSECIKELSASVKQVQDVLRGEITIVGDFNVDYNLRHTPAFKLLKDFEREFNFSQVINTSTRSSRTNASCLDLIFTNMNHITSSGTLDIATSDHLPVYLIKKKQKLKSTFTFIKARSYTRYEKQTFQEEIRYHPKWMDFWNLKENEPDKMWEIILEIIQERADAQCPLKNMKIRDDTPQWITKDILSEINLKDHLFRRAKKLRTPESWNLFKVKKNEVKKLLDVAKENYVNHKLDELEGNPRKFWRTINEMSGIGKNKSSKKCTRIIDENGKLHENLEAADFLNDYYVNVGPSLAQKHKKVWEKEKCKIQTNSSFNFKWVSEREVQELIKEICITKSSAVEGLSTRLIKDAFEVISFELTYLYNSCLQNGMFPAIWGISKVTPIPKTKANSTKPGDWRPISQICIAGKLLEKIIHAQLYNYLEENNLLSKNQFGFRKNLSTGLAIFDVLKQLYANWNERNYTGCVFVDFSRAFDTIDHNILSEKLKMYGLDDMSQKFMLEYMASRKQTTTVNGFSSSQAQVTYGTAQGSILGPLIFILYVNDIFVSLGQDNSIHMYADDTLLMCKDNDITTVTEKAQKVFQKMSVWCEANKLSINAEKTKYMVIRHTKAPQEPNFSVQGGKISTVHQYEYLGILLDDKLAMNDYLDTMWKKTNSKLGILAKIRRFISEKTAVRIYKTMIRPHLDYIDFVVDSGSADRIKRLDTLQKKALRRIEYCINVENRQDKDVLQDKYKIEDLKLRRKRNLLKIMHTLSSDSENLKTVSIERDLRSTTKVKLKNDFTSKTKVFNSPLYRGIRLWDSLPSNLQKERNKYIFKHRISLHTF